MVQEAEAKASPMVTIAIPTYNRAHLLNQAISSALSQDYMNFQVIVLDNASSDSTESLVNSFNDPRLVYIRNEVNTGMLSNWNRAIEVNNSPYLVVLQDDDVLLASFVSESLALLDKYPNAGFCYALARHIDAQGMPGNLQPKPMINGNLISGLDFLHMAVNVSEYGAIYSSSVMMRALALEKVGFFDSPHATHTIDLNLYFRLASQFDVVHLPKELLYVRFHPQQDGYGHYQTTGGTGLLGSNAERIDALSYLLRSEWAQDAAYRDWLAKRLLILNAQSSAYAHLLSPSMYWDWDNRVEMAKREISAIVAQGESFILADEEQWALGGELAGRRIIPFTSQDGMYWGPPADDAQAITQLELFKKEGVGKIIFGWPAFWWLEHYQKLNKYLNTEGQMIRKNTRLVAFNLIHS